MARIPASAYEDYLAMGAERSYSELALRYGVSKTAISKRAKRDDWQGRIREVERLAAERAEEAALNELSAVRERHLKEARYLRTRALQALRDLPPEKGIRAATALATAWRHELLILGEPTERQASVEETIRDEYQRWMANEENLSRRN